MTNQLRSNEVLYDNILDEDIQAMFFPFHLMQLLFLLPRYRIYNNFLTFNSISVNILSSLGFIIPCVLMTTRYVKVLSLVTNAPTLMFLVTYDILFHSFGFIMTYSLNIVHKMLYVELILNIQRVFKNFKHSQHKRVWLFNLISWFAIGSVVVFYLVIFLHVLFFTKRGIVEAFSEFICVYFDISVIFASRVINIFEIQLKKWISELENLSTSLKSILSIEGDFDLTLERQKVQSPGHEIKEEEINQELRRLLKIYKMIMKTYDIYKKIFQACILYHCMETFTSMVFYAKIYLSSARNPINDKIRHRDIENLFMFLTVVKNIINNFYVSFSCQSFYNTVKKANVACINAMGDTTRHGVKQICKNILRINEVGFHKMEACRLFTVDAKLPFALISSAVYYVIVVIQFAL